MPITWVISKVNEYLPCCTCDCGCVFRLSDTQLVDTGKVSQKDWLWRIENAQDRLTRRVEVAEEKLEEQRARIVEKSRKSAHRLANDLVEKVLPKFRSLKVNVQDVKPIFDPIHFIVFDGLANRDVSKIRLLDAPPASSTHERRQDQIRKAIKSGNVQWKTIRISPDGRDEED